MNGPLKMYATKPIVRYDTPVELPTCMYKMRNLHTPRCDTEAISDTGPVSTAAGNLDTFDQNNQGMPEMAALFARQEQILLQLSDLKKQMLSIRDNLKAGTPISSAATVKITPKFDSDDVVINVSPLYPPYILEALQKIWTGRIDIVVESYLHSTVNELPEQSKEFIARLQVQPAKGNLPKVTIRIIWKEVGPHPELIVAKVPIVGEVNILRYFARVTSAITYEDSNSFDLDPVLDTCYTLIQSKTKTARAAAMRVLYRRLGKSQWLCGRSDYTVADIAAYSTLKKVHSTEVNVNLTRYLQKCEGVFCY